MLDGKEDTALFLNAFTASLSGMVDIGHDTYVRFTASEIQLVVGPRVDSLCPKDSGCSKCAMRLEQKLEPKTRAEKYLQETSNSTAKVCMGMRRNAIRSRMCTRESEPSLDRTELSQALPNLCVEWHAICTVWPTSQQTPLLCHQ